MATVTKNVVQKGLLWTVYGEVSSSGTGDDPATVLDFSADIDADPFNRQGFSGYTSSKLLSWTFSPQWVTATPSMIVSFDATSDDIVYIAMSYGVVKVNWRDLPFGGLVDPKSTGYTGDVLLTRSPIASGSASDVYTFVLNGELI